MNLLKAIHELKDNIEGDILTDNLHKIIYATDASVYRELPEAVCIPKSNEDIIRAVRWCHTHNIPIIPRTAGTSLAGQVVGKGMVLDVSKYLNSILEVNAEEKWVRVQPGVIRDELNHHLKSHGLFFGPNTSTSNRAMIGGMVGNNSCGTTSIVYGNTRDHVLEMKVVLSDGSSATVKPCLVKEAKERARIDDALGRIYGHLLDVLSDEEIENEVNQEFPDRKVTRRNTGYALDELYASYNKGIFNPIALLSGSEGTLAITTEVKLSLDPLPADYEVLMAIHFKDVITSLKAVPLVMAHAPFACELMDKTILDCTKGQLTYAQDRFFLEGDPAAVLMVSFRADSIEKATEKLSILETELKQAGLGYSFPIISENVDRIWNLRKAGLGLLANIPGEKAAVACIEDTAVSIDILADYIKEFESLMASFGQKAVYYAHAGAGELHLRPILNLKSSADRRDFEEISRAVAILVKKYNGSLSGEHGDGRVRAPFLSLMVGERLYEEFKKIKHVFDPKNILNPGKIVEAKGITEDLRYDEDQRKITYDTKFDFSSYGGLLGAAEKCNGSGDCRKLPMAGGTMCPSYQATRDEKDATRARANTLREILTRKYDQDPFTDESLAEVLDLCISCKGCTSECPSNVNMTQLKSEVLYQKSKQNGLSLRSKAFSRVEQMNKLLGRNHLLYLLGTSVLAETLAKGFLNIHPKRTLPELVMRSYRSKLPTSAPKAVNRSVYLFVDEFSDRYDVEIARKSHELLVSLGYQVKYIDHVESGRAAFSKGDLDHAADCARKNVSVFADVITEQSPLIGIEPSAILSFRDEYPLIVGDDLKDKALHLKTHSYTIEEFLYDEAQKGHVRSESFTRQSGMIHLHGHCHQKALSDIKKVAFILSLPENYDVNIIPSGCCGMAGSFGYEKEHYDISMKIGETTLFPYLRAQEGEFTVAASGTSCRHQIHDGVAMQAKHPVEIFYDALIRKE